MTGKYSLYYLPLLTVLIRRHTAAQLFIFGYLSVRFKVNYVMDLK